MNEVEDEQASVARVVCDHGAIRLDARVVRAHSEGVRFVFENPGGAWGFEFHPLLYEHGSSKGGEFYADTVEENWSLPPGEVTVACLPDARSSYYDPGAVTATITVVDPDGLYVSPYLVCGSGEQFRLKIEGGENEDPAGVFRRVSGVRPSDQLTKPFYPGTPLHWPTFLVVRDGDAVARIGGPEIGDEWKLFVDACPGSGIARS
jgi:hypothetical protein